MSTAVMLRDQLSELRMVIDHDDPAHVAAEAAFAAMVAEIMQAADIGPRNRGVSTNADVVVLQGTPRLVEEIEHPGEGPPAESLALRLDARHGRSVRLARIGRGERGKQYLHPVGGVSYLLISSCLQNLSNFIWSSSVRGATLACMHLSSD